MPSTDSPVLADVNVWLATIVEQHPHHAEAIGWWRIEVLPSATTVCFCRITQLGLLRLLTNESVMGAARRTPRQAWADYDHLLEQTVVDYLDEPGGVSDALRDLTGSEAASPSLWTDAYLAAFARAAGIELATFDRGFRRFAGLDLRTLG